MNFEPITNYLDSLDEWDIPARDLSIWQDHRQIYRHRSGYTDGAARPVSAQDIYWQYSTTKLLCCTAALRLIEQGLLSLESAVEEYLPAFGKLTIQEANGQIHPAKGKMTIRHLMTMTGGLDYRTDTPELLALSGKENSGNEEVATAIAARPLSFEPGTDFQYSLCHDVLGMVIAVVCQKTLGGVMKEEIFQPLQMNNTGFFPTHEQRKHFTGHFQFDSAAGRAVTVPHQRPFAFTPCYESGGGGLFSTVDDYIRFADALACGGIGYNGYRLLQPESLRLLSENQLSEYQLRRFQEKTGHLGNGYGLGVMTLMDQTPRHYRCPIGTFGWGGACGTKVYVDPRNRISIYFAMEATGGRQCEKYEEHPHNRLVNLFYTALEEK